MKEKSETKKILIIDDNRLFCDSVQEYFASDKLEVATAQSLKQARAVCLQRKFDVILLDYDLPDGTGLSLTADILRFNDNAKIILVTGQLSFDRALPSLDKEVYGYLQKPVDMEELRIAMERALRASELEQVAQLQDYRSKRESEAVFFIGDGPAYYRTQDLIRRAAATNASVIITGETGTGKNVVAKQIHYSGASSQNAFLTVNCAAMNETVLDAELFGVEKSAFAGVLAPRKGAFEIANKGTLFLDEIEKLPYSIQSKLLNALEERKVRRIGGNLLRDIDVRVIAATSLEPERAIRDAGLRRDLYYRLSIIHIHLEPLRERINELPILADFFIKQFAPDRKVAIPEVELRKLEDYDWPGNVRELRNVIERSLILQEGEEIFPSQILAAPLAFIGRVTDDDEEEGDYPPKRSVPTLDEIERNHILSTLERFSRNYSRTADALGISLSTLKRKLKEYGQR